MPTASAIGITFAGFETVSSGRAFRNLNGGWLFVGESLSAVVWFDAAVFTLTDIASHRAISGISGRLHCTKDLSAGYPVICTGAQS